MYTGSGLAERDTQVLPDDLLMRLNAALAGDANPAFGDEVAEDSPDTKLLGQDRALDGAEEIRASKALEVVHQPVGFSPELVPYIYIMITDPILRSLPNVGQTCGEVVLSIQYRPSGQIIVVNIRVMIATITSAYINVKRVLAG